MRYFLRASVISSNTALYKSSLPGHVRKLFLHEALYRQGRIKLKNAKLQLGQGAAVCVACLFFVWLWPALALAQAQGYAVQVAAVRAAPSADEMKNGLRASGLDAYWVKSKETKRAPLYQVRLGKFMALETALAYAERLRAAGLLEAYAVTTFEPPAEPVLPETLQASLEVQEFRPQGPTSDSGALLAAINSRQWWLPVNRQSFTPLSALSQRELLVYALGRHEWRLSNSLNVLLVRGSSLTARANLLPPAAVPVASPIVNQPAPPVGQFDSAGGTPPTNPSLAEGGTLVRTGVPEINRPGNRPTAARGISYALPPRLQGWVEMANGRLVMKLRNLDQERSFAGVARVTLNDERHSDEIAPLQFNLPPDSEQVFPVNETARDGDSWMLMVFDEGGAMRLLRGASLGQQAATPAQTAVANNNSKPVGVAAPPYVTGTYDATNPALAQGGQRGQGEMISPTSDAPNPAAASGVNNTPEATNPTPTASPGGAGDANGSVTATPRLIAATAENITIEFAISAPRPLNYISLTLLSGDYRDVRQALMSTPQGRVPFLVPAAQATGAFYYEIKDESGRALFSGTGDFRQLGRGQ